MDGVDYDDCCAYRWVYLLWLSLHTNNVSWTATLDIIVSSCSVWRVTTADSCFSGVWQRRTCGSVACDNGGLVVQWPAEKLTVLLDGHDAELRRSTVVRDVCWTLPYVSTATPSTTSQSHPVISVSAPVYSNRSRRSHCVTSANGASVLGPLCLSVKCQPSGQNPVGLSSFWLM